MKLSKILLSVLIPCSVQTAPLIQNSHLQIRRDGEFLILESRAGTHPMSARLDLPGFISTCSVSPVTDPAWGPGRQLLIRHGNATTAFTLYENNPFAHLETHLANPGEKTHDLTRLIVARMEIDLGVEVTGLNTLGTGGLRPYNSPKGSYAYSVLADPGSRNGMVCGWLTQQRGVGLMLPSFKGGVHHLETQLDFGLMRLQPGATRETDILQIGFFDDARAGLERYADDIAKVYNIKLPPNPGVYCTWYHRNLTGSGASNEKTLAENAAFARKHLQPFGLNVFQIDDHWQALENNVEKKNKGPVKTFISTTEHFPGGMKKTAENLQKEGFIPGIWFMPFAGDLNNPAFDPAIFAKDKATGDPFEDDRWSGTPIDASSPAGEAFLRARFKRIHGWGYRYIKVDGLHIGTPSHNIYVNRSFDGKTFGGAEIHDKEMTFIEAYRKGLAILREELPGTFILGCSATQNMVSFAPVFGLIDAMRVGPDNDKARKGEWNHLTRGADFAGNLWFLNNRVWYNDPDPFYVRESNPLDKARWMASWQAISGVMNTTSMQYSGLAPERLDMIKRTLPAHRFAVRPVDVLENKHPQIWRTGNDRMQVLGLFNWNETEEIPINYSLERMGLNPKTDYDVFDFWANRYLGTIRGEISARLPGAGCQVLALRKAVDHPQLLSTSRHITQGLIDVVSEVWNTDCRELSGASNVVANDPYEMRIVCPKGFQPLEIKVSDKSAGVSVIEQTDGLARITVTPSSTGRMEWNISFQSP